MQKQKTGKISIFSSLDVKLEFLTNRVKLTQFSVESSHVKLKIWAIRLWIESNSKCQLETRLDDQSTDISEWYSHLQQDLEKTLNSCERSARQVSWSRSADRHWQVWIQDSENLVSWTTDVHQWSTNELSKSRCDSKLRSVAIIDSCADLHWLLQFLSMIHKELLKDCSTHDKADSKRSSLWMNRDLSNNLWRIKATDDDSLRSEAFQLDQRSYSENELLELCERWSIVSIWRWRHLTFNDLL